ELAAATVEAFWADPLGRAGAGPQPADARALLGGATTRFVYDLDAYHRTKDSDDVQPVAVATIARERHVADPELAAAGQPSRLRVAFGYSDGLGREIQTKLPAAPDRAQPPPRPDRWICSGWVVLNNKSLPVRQYEPAFRPTHRFEFDLRVGVSPILCYDPLGRAVATLHPDHTYEKVTFDPWSQHVWDAGDTAALRPGQTVPDPGPVPDPDPEAGVRGNPARDADIAGFVAGLEPGDYTPTWYRRRAATDADPRAEFGALAPYEQSAARRALRHAATPTATYLDPLGRPVLAVAHNREPDTTAAGAGDQAWDQLTWIDSVQRTHTVLDIHGNQLQLDDCTDGDPDRLDGQHDRVVARHAFDLVGNSIAEHSLEAGSRWRLTDAAGHLVAVWESVDGGGQRLLATHYDRLRRPTETQLTQPAAAPGATTTATVTQTIYGEDAPNPEASNLRGQVWRTHDGAGRVEHAYDVHGNPAATTRTLATDYHAVLDWAANPQPKLEADTWTSTALFDALDRLVRRTHPDGTVIAFAYDEAGLLTQVRPHVPDDPPGVGTDAELITNIDYNPRGQRTRVDYGSGVHTEYTYDPDTFRLRVLRTIRPPAGFPDDGPVPPDERADVQNLAYVHDPVGNITHLADDAQPTIFRLNTRIAAAADYVYDAAYRLVEATGREHLGLPSGGGPQPSPSWTDAPQVNLPLESDRQALGTYRERYTYDTAGNLTALEHRGTDPAHPGWRRTFSYQEPSQLEPAPTPAKPEQVFSNRLTATGVGASGPAETFTYGERGTMSLPWLTAYSWDYRDQLATSSTQWVTAAGARPRTTYYVYDGAGERVRKVTDDYSAADEPLRPAEERVYLGDFDLYRTFDADGSPTLVRCTVHVVDGEQRIALLERRLTGADATPTDEFTVRYQHANHLGSATVELDRAGALISYEEYYPYGCTALSFTRSGVLPKRYRYTARERDTETGLTYHGARYYAPWLTRWTAPDPAGGVDGPNRYGYCRMNPIRGTDPAGRDTRDTADPRQTPPVSLVDRAAAYAGALLPRGRDDLPAAGGTDLPPPGTANLLPPEPAPAPEPPPAPAQPSSPAFSTAPSPPPYGRNFLVGPENLLNSLHLDRDIGGIKLEADVSRLVAMGTMGPNRLTLNKEGLTLDQRGLFRDLTATTNVSQTGVVSARLHNEHTAVGISADLRNRSGELSFAYGPFRGALGSTFGGDVSASFSVGLAPGQFWGPGASLLGSDLAGTQRSAESGVRTVFANNADLLRHPTFAGLFTPVGQIVGQIVTGGIAANDFVSAAKAADGLRLRATLTHLPGTATAPAHWAGRLVLSGSY
uniref:RHS repeat-associated core domain-containing protein n=1 Tax=Frankia sp. Cas3 TaxID=3073926 RepID=UPI002AD4714E